MTDLFTARGITLRDVSFAELGQIRPGLMPLFDPTRTVLRPDRSFAIVGDKDGLPVVTAAGVLRDCPFGLVHAVEMMTLFSDIPGDGERAGFHGDQSFLRHIGERVVVIGAIWRADEAGSGILPALWPILIRRALDDLLADWIIGLIRGGDRKIQRIGYEIEGFRHFWEGASYRSPDWNGGVQEDHFSLCAMSRREAMERVLKIGAAA